MILLKESFDEFKSAFIATTCYFFSKKPTQEATSSNFKEEW